ncbi:hypothetical protein BC332_23518 [Capsicum chinense]|uniref:Uncharacterized protein n=1 Tax=Capsicum annuum TaxID=4072 RepID=A0A2G2YRD7_CAPAN|nr:putative proteasome inhibitor isoform 1 [Capsicum annuum]PHT72264.1 hypothetical protein T459_23049 [Capsicum annuum]PHU07029.1 hypothetical protein BC332_23518 [Capsicum chinense]
MSSFKVHLLLISLLVINFSSQEESRYGLAYAARPISTVQQQQQHRSNKLSSSVDYLKKFETLGMVCKCCDGIDVEKGKKQELCSATWVGSCSNLQCFPWKSQ